MEETMGRTDYFKYLVKTHKENLHKKVHELDLFWENFEQESDRAIGIISACILDELLEKLIKASYIKDTNIRSIFRNDTILQSFFAKINIAYFSGFIPKILYHDLKLICEIRNKFAHAVIADLRFNDKDVIEKINKFEQIPKDLIDVYPAKLRFLLAVVHTATILQDFEVIVSMMRPPHLVEFFEWDKIPHHEMILSPDKIGKIILKQQKRAK